MQKYPEKVFLEAGIDLGSGSGSPIEVDYDCKGGLASLDFINKLYNLTETIRSEGPQHICSGSIVHAHWRYYHYDLLKAGFAPELHIKHTQEWEQNSDELVQNTSAYMKFWARQSLYNFELYNSLITEYDQVRPLLVHYYQDKFRVSNEKAELYTKYALMEFTGRAFGSYPHDTQIKESEIEKIIIRQDVTTDDLRNVLNGETQQDDLDRALRVALLYQKPQIYLELLFKKGAKINVGDESALFFSLRNQKNIEFLLKQGANVNYENGFGKTALYYAIGFNNHTVVQLLVDHNADVNHTYKSKKALDNTEGQDMPFYQSYCMLEHTKRTPLMHAAQHSDVAMIKLLIKNGSHLRTEDEQGFNAADYAFIGKKSDNIDYLKSLGLQRNKPE